MGTAAALATASCGLLPGDDPAPAAFPTDSPWIVPGRIPPTPLLGLGFSTITTSGADRFVITLDLRAQPDTSYDFAIHAPGGRVVTTRVETNELGLGTGTKEVSRRGIYTVELLDQHGNVLTSGTVEIE